MLTDPIFIVAVLSLNVFLSEWLVRHSFCRHFGAALLVIVLTAIVANLGVDLCGDIEIVAVQIFARLFREDREMRGCEMQILFADFDGGSGHGPC